MSSAVEDDEVAGRVGHVSVAIPGGNRPGEVVVQIRGGTERYIAYCDVAVGRGEPVLVTTERGGRCVDVVSNAP